MIQRNAKKYALVLLLFFGLLIQAQEVLAHATPITYEPEASSLSEKAPERIQIRFSERIEQGASGIIVYAPDGSQVDNNDAIVDPKDAHFYGATTKSAGIGTYTVSWQVVSADDGHFTKGAFSFSVGKVTSQGVTGGQIQIQHITTIPQAVTIGIELVGQAMLLSALLLLIFLWRPLRKQFGNDFNDISFEKKFSAIIGIGVILVIVGVASFIVIKTFDLQQLRFGTFFEIFKVFLGTVDGSWALARGVLGFIFLVLFWITRKRVFASEKISSFEYALWAILFLILLDRARVSHAAASHFLPTFSILINAMHLFFKELWVGGLIVISTLLLPAFLKIKNALVQSFAFTLFSKIVSIAFGGVGITGAYIVWLHLKDPQYIFSTEWGYRFIMLSLFAMILFAARLWHQFLVEKSAVAICKGKSNNKKEWLVRWTHYSLPFEALVGIALLFTTSLIIITTPPYPPTHFAFEKQAESQGVEITLSVHPHEQNKFLITATDAKTKSELQLKDIIITLTNEEKGIGPIVAGTEQRFIGGYVLPTSLLSPIGKWKIDVSARRPGAYDAVASFLIDYPREVEATRTSQDARSFGSFEIYIILITLGILVLTFGLFRFSKKLNLVCMNLANGSSAMPSQDQEAKTGIIIPWIVAFAGLVAASLLIWFANDRLFKTDFQKLCQKNGHFWLQSAPVRDGLALSPNTVTGCFLDVGLYHFTDEREYKFFFQKQEVLVELASSPKTLSAGVPAELTVSLSEIKDGRKAGPARDIATFHDRILHVIIVGEDLKTFTHIHPEDVGPITDEMRKEGRFPLRYTFPKGGHYLINVGYIASGRELSHSIVVNVASEPKMERPNLTAQNGSQTKEFNSYRVTFSSPKIIKAGERTKLSYYIEKDGKPISDLEPYLAAAMHIALVRQDFGLFRHTHGEASQPGSVWFQQLFGKYFKYHIHFAPDHFGPKIITQPWTTIFPSAGMYQVFGEFKYDEKIVVSDFTIEVK